MKIPARIDSMKLLLDDARCLIRMLPDKPCREAQMGKHISMTTRREILGALTERYRRTTRPEKTRIINEFMAITGYHRKHVIRLMRNHRYLDSPKVARVGRRVYNDAVREALITVWEAADRICSKRLKVVIPGFVENMERNGHLSLDPIVREKLGTVSVSTIDRLLAPVRDKANGSRRRRRRQNSLIKARVPIRTFSDWDNEPPGYCEADFVAHNGGVSTGACVHTLVVTDVASGWTEGLPLVSRQQELVVEALEVLRAQMPMKLLGLDTDNDSAFMNETVFNYCLANDITFTRSRAYRKNDQAWIEQKNGSVVRRLVGYGRFVGIVAAHTLGRLYQLSRLYVNFFQPSFKLRSKTREGTKITKRYFKPATPCDRLLYSEEVSTATKDRLQEQRRALDPVRLLHGIREIQGTLVALAKPPGSEYGDVPASQSIDAFLEKLPYLWRDGEARPTHRSKPVSPRTWRTRIDPFKGVWPTVLGWLQDEPDATAKEIFERLSQKYPDAFQPGQLRTLQRRVREWRQAMARELIYAGAAKEGEPEQMGHVAASEEQGTVPLARMGTLSGVPLYVGEAD